MTVGELSVVVHRDADVLAAAAAARLMVRIVDAQQARGTASIVLTGGGVGIGTLKALNASPARDAIDWGALDIWWGDERYLAAGDPERNEVQATEALLDHVPVDPARVHRMPADTGSAPESAAEQYADELSKAARAGASLPKFDVLMLGVGPEGHIASIFPESPAAYDEGLVTAVRNCPKPPPTRISLTFGTITSADEVWLLAAGAGKAEAVGLALAGAGRVQIPAAGARGGVRTLWLVDEAAAVNVPPNLRLRRS
ncbi:6-phosphogluconolactonase [Cryptosporangium aurantiacum]|uniref:6-phosphogluconolactonase n=1 Tax=Cryptosporangium aurantiacum TaxID=134849 RepID=A0A1M7J5L0_9ACTN|nr:6-phosphogluconolactonase [Cryptosporangium aurantiacum]SHM48163.1 6-phosphogluconolactonase [Cryptosporangium aurantiacum]